MADTIDTEASPASVETAIETDAAATAPETVPSSDANAASSSAATSETPAPRVLLDVIKDAVESKAPEGEASLPSKDVGSAPEPAKPEAAKPGAEAEPDDTNLPFHTHPRFQQLIGQKAAAEERVKQLTQPAEQFELIENFRKEQKLEIPEVVRGYQLMALVKNDPERAIGELLGVVKNLRQIAGYELSEDLKRQVEEGSLSEDHARQISIERSRRQRAEKDAATSRSAVEAERRSTAGAQARAQAQAAVEEWETGIKARDPDYAAKAPMIMDRVKALVLERGAPTTTQEAVDLARHAYQHVSDKLRGMRPPPVKTGANPRSSSSAAAVPPPRPKTFADAIRLAVSG